MLHVDDEAHLLNLCRYIHANPVKGGVVDKIEDWPYSNYLDWIGVRNGQLVDREFIGIYFESSEAYRAFVGATHYVR